MMKPSLVGGPLLGEQQHDDNNGTGRTFTPLLITTTSSSDSNSERFILLPTETHISVVAYRTGQRVASLQLLVQGDEDDDEDDNTKRICSVTRLGDHHHHDDIVWVGCSNGTVLEFDVARDLASLLILLANTKTKGACLMIAPPMIQPRRVYRIADEPCKVAQLTATGAAVGMGTAVSNVVLYALLERPATEKGLASARLVRVLVPKAEDSKVAAAEGVVWGDLTKKKKKDGAIQTLDTFDFATARNEENDKTQPSTSERPFFLSVVATPQESGSYSHPSLPSLSSHDASNSVFVVVASPTTLKLYYDPLAKTLKLREKDKYKDRIQVVSLKETLSMRNTLTCCQISPNKKDIVVGLHYGMIRVLGNALSLAHKLCLDGANSTTPIKGSKNFKRKKKGKPMKLPAKEILIRTVHWHAHPVATLAYDNCGHGNDDAMLYSGGEESVLVTWQLARGSDRPAHVLPRIALGGILQILHMAPEQNSSNRVESDAAILVYCSDNSLHLFKAHNRDLIWKVQGLAASRERPTMLPSHVPTMVAGHGRRGRGDTLILSGLSAAPGYIHWFDPKQQSVVDALEVAPFNRVSRTEDTDTPLPSPTITHAMWSRSGADMMTIDIVPTENSSIGAQLETFDDSSSGAPVLYGAVSTVRFWSATGATGGRSKPFGVVAKMTYPHGITNKVSAVALSADGQYACTVSNDEKAFRLWRRGPRASSTLQNNRSSGERQSTVTEPEGSEWICRCKVTTPAGYSNFGTGKFAVAFSSDASVLAVAFGGTVTMWDHHEVTLLTSIRHGDNDATGEIQSLQFLDTNRLPDVLLINSATSVSLRSAYGNRGPEGFGWNWTLPYELQQCARVSCVAFHPADEVVAIALYGEEKKESRILFVDAVSGETCKALRESSPVVDKIHGEVISMTFEQRNPKNRRDSIGDGENMSISLCLYALTDRGEMIALENSESKLEVPSTTDALTAGDAPTEIPTLPRVMALDDPSAAKKRKYSVLEVSDFEEPPASTLSLEHFGSVGEEDSGAVVPDAELPLLRGAFTRYFLSRHLQRSEGE